MTDRKQFLGNPPEDPELTALLKAARKQEITDEDMQEQQISFAYGNAMGIAGITKDSVREASKRFWLRP